MIQEKSMSKLFRIKKTDLYDEIREHQANATIRVIKFFFKIVSIIWKKTKGKSLVQKEKNMVISINKAKVSI